MPTAAVSFAFPKSHRLKSSLLIKKTVQQRLSVFAFPIKCFYLLQEPSGCPGVKVAFLVSKKRFPHAVDRNRVKRLMRESYRIHLQDFICNEEKTLNLCWMYVGDMLPTFAQVESAAQELFRELNSKINSARS